MNNPAWIGNLITALATLAASSIALFSAIIINKNSIKNEQDKFNKQLQWEKEKIKDQVRKEHLSLLFCVYNKVLKAMGETVITYHHPVNFHTKNYNEKIRPILYESYHLLDQDIRELVRNIDSAISMEEFYDNEEYVKRLYNLYNTLFERIIDKYQEQ